MARSEGSPKEALLAYVRKVRREVGTGEVLNVIIPETVANFGLRYIVRERRLQRLKAALLAEPDVVVTNLAHHRGYEALEPGEQARRGWGAGAEHLPWRNVAVVLVAGAHNASVNGLRYARSLGADEIHALHIETAPLDTPRPTHTGKSGVVWRTRCTNCWAASPTSSRVPVTPMVEAA